MPGITRALAAGLAARADTSPLSTVCTVSNVQAALPANGTLLGIDLITSAVTASAVYNATTGGGMMKRQASSSSSSSSETFNYCNNDEVVVKYAFPVPSNYKSRFYVAGGSGFSLSSDATGGLEYSAASGAISAGYDAFNYSYDKEVLYGNGTINWDATYALAYTALGEMTRMAKQILPTLYGSSTDTKIYTYYEGCSDGRREGMSQVQRWGEEYDDAITGAPAFRFAQQQVNHVYPATIEHAMDYYTPTCASDKIVNATIAACDPLDGRTNGVISRTDLCKLNFDLSSLVGGSYYCAATTSSSLGFGFSNKVKRQPAGSQSSSTPAQNGTITEKDIAVAQAYYDGLHNSQGEHLSHADPTWDNSTQSWTLNSPSTGGQYNLDGVTYDNLVEWMTIGYFRYLDSLQTTIPDLTPFQKSGGKLLHYHGKSDPSIPSASSVHYWQSVRSIVYPNSTDEEAQEALSDWYQFYLIPGAAHCGANTLQPGPYPQDNMQTMIDWVENGVKPSRLNAAITSTSNPYEGEVQQLCQWPSRPLWQGHSSTFDCVSDQASIDSWTYTFPAFKVPIY
ncbi:Tannase [Fulvia fulva]|nr:Tannase [Fulvia fulva]